jgi:hypothetical protein
MIRPLSSILLALCLAAPAFSQGKPDIVLFPVDDMGPMDTSVAFMTDEVGEPKRHPLSGR